MQPLTWINFHKTVGVKALSKYSTIWFHWSFNYYKIRYFPSSFHPHKFSNSNILYCWKREICFLSRIITYQFMWKSRKNQENQQENNIRRGKIKFEILQELGTGKFFLSIMKMHIKRKTMWENVGLEETFFRSSTQHLWE